MSNAYTNFIKTFVIVPARSGSKGIADKNIKMLAGKPLLAWTAEAIQQAHLRNYLAVLSTDSEAYAEVGRSVGLTVPFLRPATCADDTSSALQVVEHALAWFNSQYDYLPVQVMWLQPTSPLRSAAVINQAMELIAKPGVEAVVGCKQIHRDLTTLFAQNDGFLTPLAPKQAVQTRRQDVKPLLTPNGAMYLCKTAALLEQRTFFPEQTLPLIMDDMMSLDIDTPTDWKMAEALFHPEVVNA